MTATETKWLERVREWRSSGKSAEEYAEGRGFKGSTLKYWASMLRGVGSSESPAKALKPRVRMIRIVRRDAGAVATIEVAVGAARVVVRNGFDRALLRQVVEALGGGT